MSSIVRIFIDYLKWRWQEKWHLNLSKRREVFQQQLYIRLLYIIISLDLHQKNEMEMTGKDTSNCRSGVKFSITALYTIRLLLIILCPDLHRMFEMERTRKATPHFVETAGSVSLTALYTIVVYHHLSGSSRISWDGDDRTSDISICRNSVRCFSDSFIYDCCLSSFVSFVRTFNACLKWRWQEKRRFNLSKWREEFQ